MLMTAAAMLFATACDNKNEEAVLPPAEEYLLTSTPLEGSRFEAFTDTEMRFGLTAASDGVCTLAMNRVKFVEIMPVRVDITVEGIVLDNGRYAASSVIPKSNGVEFAQYEMTDLIVEVANGVLHVSFDCMTMHVEYTGTLNR